MPPSIHPSIHPTKPFKNPHYHIYSSKNHGTTEYIAHMYHYNKQIPRKNIENHKFGQKGVLGLPSDLQIQLIKTKKRGGGMEEYTFLVDFQKNPVKNTFKLSGFEMER